MRICIPIDKDLGLDSPICGHFGSAPFFLIADTAPRLYATASTRALVRAIGPPPAGAQYCVFGPGSYSFNLYAGAGRVDSFGAGSMPELARRLAGETPVYCLVAGTDRLHLLVQECPGIQILARQADSWLVANRGPMRKTKEGGSTNP